MGTVRILAIGNSFSEDAAYYVHPMAAAAGIDVKIVNLYIGGCSLETHWRNMESGAVRRHRIIRKSNRAQ